MINNVFEKISISPGDSDIDRAKKIIWYAFFGSIAILFIISWLIFVVLTFTSDKVTVPNLEKENIYSALKKLSDRKLISNVDPRYSEKYPEGYVYGQNPLPGTNVKIGRTIRFNVSLGSQKKALTDFKGSSLFDVIGYISEINSIYKSNINSYKVEFEYNDTIEKGKVIKQEPAGGIPIINVTSLKLWISKGKKTNIIDKLSNYSNRKIDDVTKELNEAEIQYNFKYKYVDNKNDDMTIISQNINAGTPVKDIIANKQIVTLEINKYKVINENNITGTYLLDLPKKPLNYVCEVKVKDKLGNDITLVRLETQGGYAIPVPYSSVNKQKLFIFIDNELFKEEEITDKK